MNSDIIKGKIKQVQGKLLDAKGDFTEDPADDLKGKLLQAEGKAQEILGRAEEAAEDLAKHKK